MICAKNYSKSGRDFDCKLMIFKWAWFTSHKCLNTIRCMKIGQATPEPLGNFNAEFAICRGFALAELAQ